VSKISIRYGKKFFQFDQVEKCAAERIAKAVFEGREKYLKITDCVKYIINTLINLIVDRHQKLISKSQEYQRKV